MNKWKLLALTGLALVPFTGGLSLLITLGAVVGAFRADFRVTFPTYTDEELDEWQRAGYARVDAYLKQKGADEGRDFQIRYTQAKERHARAERAKEALKPPLYAMYQCRNAFCRHRERLMICHGDSQECQECCRRMYREG